MNFMNVTCVYSNLMAKVKKPLMAILGAYVESVNVLIAAPIN